MQFTSYGRFSRKNWKAVMGESKIRRRNQKSGIRKQKYESREWRIKDVVKREITISFTKRVYGQIWVSRFEKCVKHTQKMSEKCVIRLLYYLPLKNGICNYLCNPIKFTHMCYVIVSSRYDIIWWGFVWVLEGLDASLAR